MKNVMLINKKSAIFLVVIMVLLLDGSICLFSVSPINKIKKDVKNKITDVKIKNTDVKREITPKFKISSDVQKIPDDNKLDAVKTFEGSDLSKFVNLTELNDNIDGNSGLRINKKPSLKDITENISKLLNPIDLSNLFIKKDIDFIPQILSFNRFKGIEGSSITGSSFGGSGSNYGGYDQPFTKKIFKDDDDKKNKERWIFYPMSRSEWCRRHPGSCDAYNRRYLKYLLLDDNVKFTLDSISRIQIKIK